MKIEVLSWNQKDRWDRWDETTATWHLFIAKMSNKSFSITTDQSGRCDPETGLPSWRELRSPSAVLNAIDFVMESVGQELNRTSLAQIARNAVEVDAALADYLEAQLLAAQSTSILIDEREQANMSTSTWMEYLCLDTANDKSRTLVIKILSNLGLTRDYSDEDGELLDLPTEIEGFVRVDDGIIYGEPLQEHCYDKHEIADANDGDTRAWLENEWGNCTCRHPSRIDPRTLARRIDLMMRLAESN